jgi:hypothetical protein
MRVFETAKALIEIIWPKSYRNRTYRNPINGQSINFHDENKGLGFSESFPVEITSSSDDPKQSELIGQIFHISTFSRKKR